MLLHAGLVRGERGLNHWLDGYSTTQNLLRRLDHLCQHGRVYAGGDGPLQRGAYPALAVNGIVHGRIGAGLEREGES